MSVPALKHFWRVLAISAAIVFAYATVLRKLGVDWWADANYSHGLLIPFIIGYILWINRQRLSREPGRPSVLWGGAAVLVALFALWAGTAGSELYTQRLSLVLMLAGVVVYFWGFHLLRLTLIPLVLLFLAIPIPVIVFNKIAFPLQLFASQCAVWSMRLLNITVLRQGNVIELLPRGASETKKLEVVEACSGIRSLMTLITLAVMFAYLTYPSDRGSGRLGTEETKSRSGFWQWFSSYGFWRSAILIASAVPIAILTNALRVSGTGVLAHYYGTGVADGFFHSFSGWVIYIAAALLFFGVAWVVDRFRRTAPKRTLGDRMADGAETKSASSMPAGSNALPVEEAE